MNVAVSKADYFSDRVIKVPIPIVIESDVFLQIKFEVLVWI